MDCKDVTNCLSLYIDDQLEFNEAEEIRNHLNACPACFTEYEQLLTHRNRLGQIPNLPLPTDFKEELHKRLLQEKKITSGKQWKKYSLIAALFLVGLVSFMERDLISEKINKSADGSGAEKSFMAEEDPSVLSQEAKEQETIKTMDLADAPDTSVTPGNLTEEAPLSMAMERKIAGDMVQETSIVLVVEDSPENLSVYSENYTGSFNLQQQLFEASLDSVTPGLELYVSADEWDSIFNYLADYSHTIDYYHIENTEEFSQNQKDTNHIIIIMTRQ